MLRNEASGFLIPKFILFSILCKRRDSDAKVILQYGSDWLGNFKWSRIYICVKETSDLLYICITTVPVSPLEGHDHIKIITKRLLFHWLTALTCLLSSCSAAEVVFFSCLEEMLFCCLKDLYVQIAFWPPDHLVPISSQLLQHIPWFTTYAYSLHFPCCVILCAFN